MVGFESLPFSAAQEQLSTVQAEAVDLRRANEELAGKLVDVTRLRDELVDWACGGFAIARINSNHHMA